MIKNFIITAFVITGSSFLSFSAPTAQGHNVPAEVTASAVLAVSELGQEVVQGKFMAPIDKMYPSWKARAAKRMGGVEKLQLSLEKAAREMTKQGVSITAFRPYGKPIAFEVFPGKEVKMIDGQPVEVLRYTKWLIFVPTVTHFRAMLAGDPEAVKIESKGFQVAIADKGTDQWTFIDGSTATISDLRSLFITLPENIALPSNEKRQIK